MTVEWMEKQHVLLFSVCPSTRNHDLDLNTTESESYIGLMRRPFGQNLQVADSTLHPLLLFQSEPFTEAAHNQSTIETAQDLSDYIT